MAIPLMKQAEDGQETDEHPTLRGSAVWAHDAARAADARRTLRAFLVRALSAGRLLPVRLGIDAELVVSEMVTNAIRHAPGPCAMDLELSEEELKISVRDTSAEAPTVNRPDPHRVGGHGLHLVRTISDSLVIAPCGTGKQISAHLRLAPAPDHHPTMTVPPNPVPGRSPARRSRFATDTGRHSDVVPDSH
ncbi:hypothetical protein BU52_16785 [Streptomyces toyocaensis]|uniref:Histidine kinase/HSP90-like ATPase domain-containing protein n=1 Tax=Streptomyces toyocaensis TaxID=55952 RepID=A0A081XRA1_STRTO|nr:ATP-binding protein [Streptomyces toyocaensis]KES06074.1 hypothetical protein BU52_16785 [Streptomyces toyocaensis]